MLCPDGPRPIELIREGEYILAYDLNEQRVVRSRVLKADAFQGDFDMLEVDVSGENRFHVTTEHAFYNGSEWIPLSDLATGGLLLEASGKQVPVSTTAPRRCNGTTTYNLRTEHKTYLWVLRGLWSQIEPFGLPKVPRLVKLSRLNVTEERTSHLFS